MILKLHSTFATYTPIERIEKNGTYREAYRAEDNEGRKCYLVVYDMKALPECFENNVIPEIDIVPTLENEIFPKYIDSGVYEEGYRSLRWITSEYIDGTSLTDYVKSGRPLGTYKLITAFYNLLVAVKEISWRLKGGAHNNINTDNIIFTCGAYGGVDWHFTGFNCMAEASKGKPKFDATVPDMKFKAPETSIGRYNESSDIFSLGVVLSYLIQGVHPWKDFLDGEEELSSFKMAKIFRSNSPVLEMEDKLKEIVNNAVAPRLSRRYKRLEDFGQAIADYLGFENLNEFECFGAAPASLIESSEKEKEEEEQDNDSDTYERQSAGQPKVKIKIEEVKGNGFKDVAGMCELKNKLTRNFVDIVKNKELAERFQITPPNGILLWGPPGTGKTYISRRLGEETGMLYSLIQPSDLGNIYIHGSQSMIADLFTKAAEKAQKTNRGVLLVFDEFDSLVPSRTNNDDNNTANEVAEFLTQLNDCAQKNVYVVATTNRIRAIDPAILRKGRLDEIIYVGLPDDEARRELLQLELKNRPHDDIDIAHIAELTKGFTASDISYVVRESARCSFEESIGKKEPVGITEKTLEKIISDTRSSVTAEQMKEYEKTREEFSKGRKQERPRIGF